MSSKFLISVLQYKLFKNKKHISNLAFYNFSFLCIQLQLNINYAIICVMLGFLDIIKMPQAGHCVLFSLGLPSVGVECTR